MKKLIVLLMALVLTFGTFGCKSTSQAPAAGSDAQGASASTELSIAAAASLTAPLKEIIAGYAAVAPNVKITVNFGSSGALQTQIENGAPTDIFFSAATKQMDALNSAGLMVPDSIVSLLKNEIVLIAPSDSALNIKSFNDAVNDAVTSIALGDIKSVPAGQYAQDTFTSLNIWDKVSAKAMFGSDVKQVLSWVESGNADCGVVFKTDAISDTGVKIIASAPAGSHKAIVYPAGIVKSSAQQAAAADFIKYLQSDAGMNVFLKYGFLAG